MLISRPIIAGFALFSVVSVASSQAGIKRNIIPGVSFVGKSPVSSAGNSNGDTKADPGGAENAVRNLPYSGGESLTATEAVRSPQTDARLAQADNHFNTGRQLYFQGDLAGARREFDEAVNTLLIAPDSSPDRRRIERRLEEICDLIYRFDVEKLGAGQREEEAVVFDKAPIDEISHMTFPVDENLGHKLQSELHQTASAIPLELSAPVLGFVHYFATTDVGRSTLLQGFKRAGRYRAMIERVFNEEGVPQELIYLAQAESGFLPHAVSNKAANGLWQFIGETGATYNLNRTSSYDERFDPEKSTHAAARYLKSLYKRYGDWHLAMAAYNCGAGAVDRAVERTGYADYWELLKRHALPKETANYVPIILAITIMAKNPQDYGLTDIQADAPIEYDTIRLSANTNLNLIADATLQPVSAIRDLNPALLSTVAPTGFAVHVPKGVGESTQTALEAIPAPNRQAWRLHHVEAGDTLAAIAKTYHLAPEKIVAVNRQSENLEAGDTLLIPAVYHEELARRAVTHHASRASQPSRSTIRQRGTHVVASRHVPAQLLHRKAAVHTASLAHQ